MATRVLTVPPGVGPGETIEYADDNGVMLTAVVPEHCGPGDDFEVTDGAGAGADIMQAFGAWFERESVGDQIDRFVVENAHRMAQTGHIPTSSDSGEHSHEWWPLFLEYKEQFEVLLESFLQEAGCDASEFLAAAKTAEGMSEVYVQLFLAHSEYEMFVELMGMEALKQASENELCG